MSVCTFFGHHDCLPELEPRLYEAVRDLIENHATDTFYVGNQGAFDRLVRSVLRELKTVYPHISYAVVLAYLPQRQNGQDFSDTLLPEGVELVPPRFAISWRNRWMLSRSDYIIAYVKHPGGGAAQFTHMAERQKKTVIRL